MWHEHLVVPLQHLDYWQHVLLGKLDDLVALGLLLACGIIAIERPVGLEIDDVGLLGLVFGDALEVVDELLQAWGRDRPLALRVGVEL